MPSITQIEDTRNRRRTVTRFCTECKMPWALHAVPKDGGLIILCKHCGHIRASLPSPSAGERLRATASTT